MNRSMGIDNMKNIIGEAGSARRRACQFFVLAFVLSLGGFLALFVGVLDKFVRGGFSLLCFIGFAVALNKAFHYWDKLGSQ